MNHGEECFKQEQGTGGSIRGDLRLHEVLQERAVLSHLFDTRSSPMWVIMLKKDPEAQ